MALTRKQALQILGLLPGSSDEEIKKAYRKAAMKHHPDRGGNAEEFKKAAEAYELLSRKEEEKSPFQFNRSGHSYEDILNELRNFEKEWGNKYGDVWDEDDIPKPKQAKIFESTIQVTLKEAYEGCKKVAAFNILGGKEFDIEIPPGLVPGSKLRTIAADDSTGQPLIIQTVLGIKLTDEKVTWAKEPNIYSGGVDGSGDIEIPAKINWLDIMLGRYITVDTIDGATLSVRVLPGIEANQRIRIKGRGYWKDSHQNQRGDLYLRVIPYVPKLADVPLKDLSAFMDEVGKIMTPEEVSKDKE